MKNCEPFPPDFILAIPTIPRLSNFNNSPCFLSSDLPLVLLSSLVVSKFIISSGIKPPHIDSPSFPVLVGSPNCIMNPGMSRSNVISSSSSQRKSARRSRSIGVKYEEVDTDDDGSSKDTGHLAKKRRVGASRRKDVEVSQTVRRNTRISVKDETVTTNEAPSSEAKISKKTQPQQPAKQATKSPNLKTTSKSTNPPTNLEARSHHSYPHHLKRNLLELKDQQQ
ncbi:hypothetical protein WICPIJ_007915 [Wickerhamomyces pijperi]|uniref:Uncharacterized protein n=1 Tax=Wickerhamomyces pijperi TaxID=599730 RepID=A0A9P8TJN0_WICPI|nr:hypothetical protein WICPIJ_007915 [Wickerhamomyces pijperi]